MQSSIDHCTYAPNAIRNPPECIMSISIIMTLLVFQCGGVGRRCAAGRVMSFTISDMHDIVGNKHRRLGARRRLRPRHLAAAQEPRTTQRHHRQRGVDRPRAGLAAVVHARCLFTPRIFLDRRMKRRRTTLSRPWMRAWNGPRPVDPSVLVTATTHVGHER